MIHITIPLEPRTKKNSQQIIPNRATGRYMIIPSKAYKEFEKEAVKHLPENRRKNHGII